MKPLVRIPLPVLLLTFVFALSSCGDDGEEAFPNLVTEMADCPTDEAGILQSIVLDDDTRLTLSNPRTGLQANALYRCLAAYVPDTKGRATLYSLTSARLLRDSTAVAQCDPTGVASLWRTRRYINLHLLPKTQGGPPHAWGFVVDSIRPGHAFLRLHHRQGSDPAAYTTDLYASLPLDLVEENDTITLRIRTFTGTKEFSFPQ